jgi:hypothetical protein
VSSVARVRLLAAAVLAAASAAALAPGQASAAACDPALTVAGVKVTGEDCADGGLGEIVIRNPKFGTTQTVKVTGLLGIAGKMRINAAKTEMLSEPQNAKLQLSVDTREVFIGSMKFGKFQLCDLEPPSTDPPPAQSDVPPDPDLSGSDARVQDESGATTGTAFVPRGVGCRETPSFKLDFLTINKIGELAGLDIGNLTAKLPTTAGFDDVKGGRVFFAAPYKLPALFNAEVQEGGQKKKVPTYVALGVQISKDEGFGLFSAGFRLDRSITVAPGVSLETFSGVADTAANRFGGGIQLRLPGNKALGGGLQLQNGDLTSLSADLALPTPIPLFGGAINVTSIGGSLTGPKDSTGPGGSKSTTPRSFQGRAKFTVGPASGGKNPFQGDMSITLAGPTVTLVGNLFTVVGDKQIKLGDARVLLSVKPLRFEAEANASLFTIIQAHIFVGITPEHFTALGEASIQVPKDIKVIGGTKLGGFSVALSDVGVGAVITVDPPIVKPITLGLGTKFKPFKFTRIDSVTQFITVKPSIAAVAAAAVGGGPAALAAAQRSLRLPGRRGDLIVSVTGTRRVPRAVHLSMAGRRLRAVRIGAGANAVQFALANPPAGVLRVTSPDALARIEVGRVRDFSYLDPSPGFGTVPRGPVTAGQTARVCWRVRNAPRGTLVDLFEDQNGNLGTGRSIASGRRAVGCFDVPTAGLEPGRHWVYGQVRAGDQPLTQRYWPVPITVVDPSALPAPAVTVTTATDGAFIGWSPVAGAGSYVIRAEPVDEYDAEPIEQDEAATSLSTALSLRGAARWNVTVQAVRSGGGRGNASGPQLVAPTDPVVVAGKPNGVAQVGRLWAFQLKVFGGVRLRLVKGPAGMRLLGGAAQLRWTPSRAAGSAAPQEFTIEGCKDTRCVQRTFHVSAYPRGFAPFGPARGFQVTPNVLGTRGGLLTIRAQGVDATPVVRIDGKLIRGVRRVNAGTIELRAPRGLRRGGHEISLKIGRDATERKPGALVVI